MAKIVTITTSFDKEMHTYQSETEDEVLDLIKWIYTNNTDIRNTSIYIPWDFAGGQREVIEITTWGYDIRERVLTRIQKWLGTKEAEKIISTQKKQEVKVDWTKIPETKPRRKPGRRKVNE